MSKSKNISIRAGGSSTADQVGLENPDNYFFFWKSTSPFSQWHPSSYELNGVVYQCAEQGMMHGKALLFQDETNEQLIVEATSPREMKKLGRRVRNFDDTVWKKHRERIVYEHNVAKFSQNNQLRQALLLTGDRIIVEASPSDRIWGIGLAERNAVRIPAHQWPGKNLLGKVLMNVRATLIAAQENVTDDGDSSAKEKV